MKKTNKLVIVMVLLSACTTEQVPKPTVNPSTMATASISSTISSPPISPKETISPGSITITDSPVVEKTIKKVDIYNKRNGYLLSSSDDLRSKKPNERTDFDLIDNYYYDLDVKVTYSDNSISSNFIFKSSNDSVANVDVTGRVFTHSTIDTGLFNLVILDKNTKKECYIFKIDTTTGFQTKIKTVGTIYDTENNIVKGANVSVINLDLPNDSKYILVDQPIDGTYTLRFAPVASKMEMTVSKEGYKTQKRYFIIKGDPEVETFNFGGNNPDDKQYALEKI